MSEFCGPMFLGSLHKAVAHKQPTLTTAGRDSKYALHRVFSGNHGCAHSYVLKDSKSSIIFMQVDSVTNISNIIFGRVL